MFEKEIKFITDFNLNRIKRAGSLFTLESLTSAGVHPSIVQYVSAELEYLIYLDRQKLLQKSVFDYSGEEITKYFTLIAGEIKKKKLIPYEDVKRLVEQAVMFNVNFVLRPNWTYMKFIFNGDELKSTEEIILFMNYAYYYGYIKNIITNVIEKRKILALSNIEFEEFLEKIQAELLSTQVERVYEDSLTSISDFINQGEVNKKKISVGTYEIFLKEKNLSDSIYKLRKLLSVDPKQKFDIKDVAKALMANIPIEVETKPEPEVQEVELETAESKLVDEPVEELVEDVPATTEPVEIEEELPAGLIESNELEIENEIEIESTVSEDLIDYNPHEEDDYPVIETPIDDLEVIEDTEMQPDEFPAVEDIEEEIESTPETESIPESAIEEDETSESEPAESTEDTTTEDLLSLYLSPEPEEELEIIENESEPEEEDYLKILMEDKEIKEEASKDFSEVLEETANDILPEENEEKETIAEDNVDIEESQPEEAEEPEHSQPVVETHQEKENVADEDSPQIDLFDYFTAKESMKIVAVIFNQDSIDFVNTLERITECRNFDEANEVLKAVFFSYKINPFTTKEAMLLKQRIENYFRDRFR